MLLKAPMMYLQKLKVLILVAWPNCCLNHGIVDFPSSLERLHLTMKFIPSLHICATLPSFVKYCVALHVFEVQLFQLGPADVA